MGLAKTWTNYQIEPLSGDPLSGLDCTTSIPLQVRKAVSTWLEEGWISALESLVASSPSSAKSVALWNRVVQAAARAVLGLYRVTSNIHSSFNPHLMVSWHSTVDIACHDLIQKGHSVPVFLNVLCSICRPNTNTIWSDTRIVVYLPM